MSPHAIRNSALQIIASRDARLLWFGSGQSLVAQSRPHEVSLPMTQGFVVYFNNAHMPPLAYIKPSASLQDRSQNGCRRQATQALASAPKRMSRRARKHKHKIEQIADGKLLSSRLSLKCTQLCGTITSMEKMLRSEAIFFHSDRRSTSDLNHFWYRFDNTDDEDASASSVGAAQEWKPTVMLFCRGNRSRAGTAYLGIGG